MEGVRGLEFQLRDLAWLSEHCKRFTIYPNSKIIIIGESDGEVFEELKDRRIRVEEYKLEIWKRLEESASEKF